MANRILLVNVRIRCKVLVFMPELVSIKAIPKAKRREVPAAVSARWVSIKFLVLVVECPCSQLRM